jgi:ectoine utilization protein EutD
MVADMQPFPRDEYLQRIGEAKQRMEAQGFDVLLITDPANMNYLTGYDGWSFYTPQVVVVALKEELPIWIGRGMDANGARATTFLPDSHIVPYPDHYVQAADKHPMNYVAGELRRMGLAKGTIALEMDSYYFSPMAYETLRHDLPDISWRDSGLLVNWVRAVKSPRELAYMNQAARIVEKVMETGIESIRPGVRQCDAVAQIYHAQISGTEEFGGDYPSIVPMLPTGIETSTPHITWRDAPYKLGEATILELAGCRLRYHCPMARTLFLGKPTQKVKDTADIVVEGLNRALETARPGLTCEDVEAAWREAISRHGIIKESRIGYSTGLNYPPDWGEHTMSLRPGDQTELQTNMTFHMICGIWEADWGIEISECFRITETGAEPFCDFPRRLFVKE